MAGAKTVYRYEEIAEDLRQRIRRGAYTGVGKLPSEHDLADTFGVNRLTLRKAVDLLEEEGIVTRHRGKGTYLGGAPSESGTQQTVVYVGDVSEHYWSDVYATLGELLQDGGHQLLAYHANGGSDANGFAAWLSGLADPPAVVCQINRWATIEPVVLALGCPAVALDITGDASAMPVSLVTPDTQRAGTLATQHLLEAGHRRIAFLGFGNDPGPAPGFWVPYPHNPAYCGYLQAMRCAGLSSEGLAIGGYGSGEGMQAQLEAFIDYLSDWPTAIVCQQDYKARDLLAVAARHGLRLPRDLSIVSIGNTPWAEALMPSLTSIDLTPRAMANLALHVLQSAPSDLATIYRLEPTIIKRESVQPMESS